MAVVHRTGIEEVALGMTLLGLIFSSMLYGITLTQTYKYFQRFPNDSRGVKILVVIVWSLNAELMLSMLISGVSEGFLTYRVWMLSKRRVILTGFLVGVFLMALIRTPSQPVPKAFLALLHFASGEVAAIQFLSLKQFARFGSVKIPSILRLSSAACCDTGIALSLCYFLHQKRTGFERYENHDSPD
ncbi:hypothetical protein C0995_008649 [Termitomyces sp. Mi166|nr:hypothetical protein C0995_008649 [Termitomyces sp. Mi166\